VNRRLPEVTEGEAFTSHPPPQLGECIRPKEIVKLTAEILGGLVSFVTARLIGLAARAFLLAECSLRRSAILCREIRQKRQRASCVVTGWHSDPPFGIQIYRV